MLCTSILSEVVLGFMLWSGWLGAVQTSESPMPECSPEASQGYYPSGMAGGMPCPQACYPAPVCQPLMTPSQIADGVEIRKIQSLPSHLAACDIVQPSPNGAPVSGTTMMPCKKPCFWSFQTAVMGRSPTGVIADVTMNANNAGVKETYSSRHFLRYDTPTNLVLSGDQPEPVCVQVVARATDYPQALPQSAPMMPPPMPQYGLPMLPPPMYLPMPVPALSPIYPTQSTRIPDPLPLVAAPIPMPQPEMYRPWSSPLTPVSLSIPAPTPAHRATVKVVYESGKARLCVQSEGMTTECLRMKLEAGAAGAVRLSAGKNHVHIVGTKWKAQADRIELGNDGRIVLTGHVKLLSDKLGVCAAIKADQVCVQIKAGKFEKIIDQK